MGQIAFDTHSFVKRLTDVGMPEPQAEVLAGEQARLIESDLATKRDIEDVKRDIAELRAATARDIAELRTETGREIEELRATVERDIAELRAATTRDIAEVKRDIEALRAEVKRDIAELRTEVKRDLKELEQRLTVRLGGMMMAAVAVLAALVKLL